jgi:hypothetical protein
MSSVTFPAVAGGATYTDDTNASTGLGGGGHRTRFVPALKAVVDLAASVAGIADVLEVVQALGNVSGTKTINLSLGTIFTATATGNCVWSFSNPRAGISGITLQITNGGVSGQTFPGVKFPSGFSPNLTASGTDLLEFFSSDGWTTISGCVAQRDIK